MKNKLLFAVLFIASLFLGLHNVAARQCTYDYNGNTITLNFKQNQQTKAYNAEVSVSNASDYMNIYNFVDGNMVTSDDQCYKSLNVCELQVYANTYAPDWTQNIFFKKGATIIAATADIYASITDKEEIYLAIFGSSLDMQTIDDPVAGNFDFSNRDFWEQAWNTGQGGSCKIAEYKGDSKDVNFVSFCAKFVELYSGVNAAYTEFNNCDYLSSGDTRTGKEIIAKCKADAYSKINEETEILKDTCNTIIQNADLGATDGCVDSCLNAIETVKQLNDRYIKTQVASNKCSISDRLVTWIYNICKWIKFILPAFVIIFGIVDFLRAIASDKDDEMKKAQGRFIRRLIAAALVFVVPFIIEFILDKFGFIYHGCGIVNL